MGEYDFSEENHEAKMNKLLPWLISLIVIIAFSSIVTFLKYSEVKLLKDEINQPKRVEIVSNGQISSWPVDGVTVKIVNDK